VICPYRVQAYEFIAQILSCLPDSVQGEPFEVEHRDRLDPEYSIAELPNYLRSKPSDWLSVFGGNTDSDFKMGIRFFDKKISLFQQMSKSQMIIASPLALFLHKDGTDFTSSIEVLILDTVDALLMQPWDRLKTFVDSLNGLPKTVLETDWSRIRTYCLDKKHKQMRQTIAYGSVLTPEVHALFTSYTNIRGLMMLRPLMFAPLFLDGFNKVFKKWSVDSVSGIGECISKNFKEKLFPQIRQWRNAREGDAKRTIIYWVSSMRFLEARKRLEDNDVIFLELGDEAAQSDIKRMKKAFNEDPNAVLLITERFYFHFRPKLSLAERAVFVQPPTFPQFFGELGGNAATLTYFTEFDEMALERIVGSIRLPIVLAEV
jgi:U3 small nucleolar RNA-associated protein 25